MFDGFELEFVDVGPGKLRVQHGGRGTPVLLLHGHPRTHMTWSRVADSLASRFRVVCPDLPGFGKSYIPSDTPDHSGSSKREKAKACVELMRSLGHERFAVVGHDRGSYTAFRMAMDHPACVSRLVVLDGVPIVEALERADSRFASRWWHWFFFGVSEKPERAISADPDAWYGGDAKLMGERAFTDFREAIHNPAVVHGMIEDYRAGLGIDRQHDAEDRTSGKRVLCPTMCLWSEYDDLGALYGDVLGVWRSWTTELEGHSIKSGHHMAEEAPTELADALVKFLQDSK